MNSIGLTYLALLISVVGTIINFIYSQRQIKIMKEELNLFRGTFDKKKKLEEAVIKIMESIKIIKKIPLIDEPITYLLHDISTALVLEMHDHKPEETTLLIKPGKFEIITNIQNLILTTPRNTINTIKKIVRANMSIMDGFVHYSLSPDILGNGVFEIKALLHIITNLYDAFNPLDDIRNLIDTFESDIMGELEASINDLSFRLIRPFFNNRDVTFKLTDTFENILDTFKVEVFDSYTLQADLNHLTDELFNKRLSAIRKEMFLQS